MTATLLISVAIALLAFANGVVILGKASRENHGTIYKISGWFIIIGSLMIMACSAMHSAIHFYRWRYPDDAGFMRGRNTMDRMRGHGQHHYNGYDNDDYDMDNDDRNYYHRDWDGYRNRRNYNNEAPADTSGRNGTTR